MPPLKPRVLGAGTVLHRIHRLIHRPVFFGPPSAEPEQRYDDPDAVFNVRYLALQLETAFAETLVRVLTATDVLSTQVLARGGSELATTRPIRLYPLNYRLSAHGLTLAQVTSSQYRVPQRLSREVHEGHPTIDGILYSSPLRQRRVHRAVRPRPGRDRHHRGLRSLAHARAPLAPCRSDMLDRTPTRCAPCACAGLPPWRSASIMAG